MPSRRRVLRELDSLEGPIARAFAEAVRRIKSRARLDRLVAAIEAGDLERAFRAAGIRDGSWGLVTEEVRNAYAAGGELYAADAPARLGFEFNLSNPRAERWLRDNSSRLITLINSEQREAIRSTLDAGLQLGQNPRTTALDIVGRMDRGRRRGGIVGLNSNQAGHVNEMRRALRAPVVGVTGFDRNGDPIRKFWIGRDGKLNSTFTRRDRRFDGLIKRAIEDGTPMARADVDRLVGRYSDRLLQTRGEAISRSESLQALHQGMDESLRQAVDDGLVRADQITRTWDAAADSRTRPEHMAADGQERGPNEPFIVGGAQMMHPGDPAGGAANVINCRCVVRSEVRWLDA